MRYLASTSGGVSLIILLTKENDSLSVATHDYFLNH